MPGPLYLCFNSHLRALPADCTAQSPGMGFKTLSVFSPVAGGPPGGGSHEPLKYTWQEHGDTKLQHRAHTGCMRHDNTFKRNSGTGNSMLILFSLRLPATSDGPPEQSRTSLTLVRQDSVKVGAWLPPTLGDSACFDPARVASLDSRRRVDVAAGSCAADGEAAPAQPPGALPLSVAIHTTDPVTMGSTLMIRGSN